MNNQHILYECGICGFYHRWEWNGDCREDAERYADVSNFAAKYNLDENEVQIFSWEERVANDVYAEYAQRNLEKEEAK